jgi:hypothetical protein
MHLLQFRFDYDTTMSTAELEEILTTFGLSDSGVNEVKDLTWRSLIATSDYVVRLARRFTIRIEKTITYPGMPNTEGEKIATAVAMSDTPNFNNRLNVHVPDNSLLKITEVRVECDACTDLIQDHLKNGWRILAICPQAQRRPDYVLGRVPTNGE